MDKEKNVTINDIAEKTGFSIATVSRVINGTNTYYSKKTQQIIEEAVRELNYRPDMRARGLKKSRSYTIAYLVPQMDAFYIEIFNRMQEAAEKEGYSVILYISNYSEQLEKKHIESIKACRHDAVIISTGFLNRELNEDIAGVFPNQRVVLIEGLKKRRGIVNIGINVEDLCFEAAEYLLKLGHRKIAYISAPIRFDTLQARYDGFFKAYEKHHIPVDREMIFFCRELELGDYRECYDLINRILDQHEVTAMMIMSDFASLSAIRAAKKRGLRVPEDLSIIGFNDLAFTEYFTPALTTISQTNEKVGELSVEKAIGLIEKEKVSDSMLSGSVVYRESVSRVHKGENE